MKKTIVLMCLAVLAASCAKPEKAIKAPGAVDGQVITVKTMAGGTLVSWTAGEGAAVAKGELLGEIDPAKLQNSLQDVDIKGLEVVNQEARLKKKIEDVRANTDYLRKQVGRMERLTRDKAIAGDQLEKAQLQLKDAETSLFDLEKSLAALSLQKDELANKRASLELALKDLRVVSPVRGIILETFVSQGEMLLPGTALADVLDLASLYVEVFLEEQEVTSLKLNDKVQLQVDGMPGKTFSGTISFFGRKAEFSPKYILAEKERKALLYEVRVRLDQDLDVFKVGMPVTVNFGSR
jgi:HlyD family secretion protein